MADDVTRGKKDGTTFFPWPVICVVSLVTSAFKLLFLNSYHSTDFEVHRNWLAITSSLPISKWYYEDTSIWTLDYPPFFAWYEYALSHFAPYFDAKMLQVANLNYASSSTILFQRCSVVASDLWLLYSLLVYAKTVLLTKDRISAYFVVLAVLLNAGLLLIDHIHFQYNGFLFGFLILSIAEMHKDNYLLSAFWFTILLNFKHIYLYIAPVYFVYLLRSYCFKRNRNKSTGLSSLIGVNLLDFSFLNTLQLGCIVVSIFALSFGPFVYMGQLGQVLSRLFPVKRGLCHAYWAANFWAVYNSIDKIGTVVGLKFGYISSMGKIASLTGGLVAEQTFTILPNVPPLLTAIFTLVAMLPALLKVWYRPFNRALFLPCLTLCAYASFLFGYHVHEKAILLVLVPLTFLSVVNVTYARVFTVLSITGHYALFPLLYEPREAPIKVLIFLLYTTTSLLTLQVIHKRHTHKTSLCIPFVSWYEAVYIYGFLPLYFYTTFGHQIVGLDTKLPFLPLLMTSLYCSIGVVWSWLICYWEYMRNSGFDNGKLKET